MNPVIFSPIYMERVWGGRGLEQLPERHLPKGAPIGESWEVVDRPEAQSVVTEGPLRGKTLHELWTDYRGEIFGRHHARGGERFPLLCKLLDARDRLSVQVHPPARIAQQLGGEPKTEMWYFLACDPGSTIYAGLVEGATRGSFEASLDTGTVESCLHVLSTRQGDSIFIPSGRLHAIGAGNIIVEIQQNSDTTYRVFDWNRTGLDGHPRELHVEESLASIDFDDHAPALVHAAQGVMAECPSFRVEKKLLTAPATLAAPDDFAIVTVVRGEAVCGGRAFYEGDFFLLPAGKTPQVVPTGSPCAVLVTTLPSGAAKPG